MSITSRTNDQRFVLLILWTVKIVLSKPIILPQYLKLCCIQRIPILIQGDNTKSYVKGVIEFLTNLIIEGKIIEIIGKGLHSTIDNKFVNHHPIHLVIKVIDQHNAVKDSHDATQI